MHVDPATIPPPRDKPQTPPHTKWPGITCPRHSAAGNRAPMPVEDCPDCHIPPDASLRPPPGTKNDAGKPRWSLLPLGFVRGVVEVLEVGAAKYDVDNWQKVPDARRRYYDAAHRHIEAWWEGERDDADDGLHHLLHAGCCVAFAWWLDVHGAEEPPCNS